MLLYKRTIPLFLSFSFSFFISAQLCIAQSARYGDTEIFEASDIQISENIIYGVATNKSGISQNLTLDIYYPKEAVDSISQRPLVVFVHGGSFKGGDKNTYDNFCLAFAQRGYVAATINYRIGWNKGSKCTGDPNDLNLAIYRSIQDTKAALRFICFNDDKYGVDTSNVFLGGVSAGATNALHVAFSDEEEIIAATGNASIELGDLETSGNIYSAQYQIKAVSNQSGCLFNLNDMDDFDKIHVVSFHGGMDLSVPPDSGAIFGCTDPVMFKYVFGSASITNQLAQIGMSYEYHFFPSGDHSSEVYSDDYLIRRSALFFQNILNGNFIQTTIQSDLITEIMAAPEYNCQIPQPFTLQVNALNGVDSYSYKLDSGSWSLSNAFLLSDTLMHTISTKDYTGFIVEDTVQFNPISVSELFISIVDQTETTICAGDAYPLFAHSNLPFVQWYLNDASILDANINSYSALTSGTYTCIAYDDCDNSIISNPIEVEFAVPPTITIDPVGYAYTCQNDTLVLTATSTDGDLQWFKNDVALFNETSAILATNTLATFSCHATNACGTTVSNTTTLNYSKYPKNVIVAAQTIICPGDSLLISCSASPSYSYSWYKDNVIALGENASYSYAKEPGNYTCYVTNLNSGCGKFSNAISITDGCKESLEEKEVSLFPNPTSGIFQIACNAFIMEQISILDLLGNEIQKENNLDFSTSIQCDISNQPNGIYFVAIENKNEINILKLIKE